MTERGYSRPRRSREQTRKDEIAKQVVIYRHSSSFLVIRRGAKTTNDDFNRSRVGARSTKRISLFKRAALAAASAAEKAWSQLRTISELCQARKTAHPGESHMEIWDSNVARKGTPRFRTCAPNAALIPKLLRTPEKAPYAIALTAHPEPRRSRRCLPRTSAPPRLRVLDFKPAGNGSGGKQ